MFVEDAATQLAQQLAPFVDRVRVDIQHTRILIHLRDSAGDAALEIPLRVVVDGVDSIVSGHVNRAVSPLLIGGTVHGFEEAMVRALLGRSIQTRGKMPGTYNYYSIAARARFLHRIGAKITQCVGEFQSVISQVVSSLPVWENPVQGIVFNHCLPDRNPAKFDDGFGLVSDNRRTNLDENGNPHPFGFPGVVNSPFGKVEVDHWRIPPFGAYKEAKKPFYQFLAAREIVGGGTRPIVHSKEYADICRGCGGIPERAIAAVVVYVTMPWNYEDQSPASDRLFSPVTLRRVQAAFPVNEHIYVGQDLAQDGLCSTLNKTIRGKSVVVTDVREDLVLVNGKLVTLQIADLDVFYPGEDGRKIVNMHGHKAVIVHGPQLPVRLRYRDKFFVGSSDIVVCASSVRRRKNPSQILESLAGVAAMLSEREIVITKKNERDILRDIAENVTVEVCVDGTWHTGGLSIDGDAIHAKGPYAGVQSLYIVREPRESYAR
jgi:hypothetical protein